MVQQNSCGLFSWLDFPESMPASDTWEGKKSWMKNETSSGGGNWEICREKNVKIRIRNGCCLLLLKYRDPANEDVHLPFSGWRLYSGENLTHSLSPSNQLHCHRSATCEYNLGTKVRTEHDHNFWEIVFFFFSGLCWSCLEPLTSFAFPLWVVNFPTVMKIRSCFVFLNENKCQC